MLLGTGLGSTTLILVSGLNKEWGISDHTFVLSDSVVLTVLGKVSKLMKASLNDRCPVMAQIKAMI